MVLKPGIGWKQLKGPVWEHKKGVRIHISGLILRIGGISAPVDEFNNRDLLNKLVKVNGGNKKRGLMAFALNFV